MLLSILVFLCYQYVARFALLLLLTRCSPNKKPSPDTPPLGETGISGSALLCPSICCSCRFVGANFWAFWVPDRSISLALGLNLRFYASEVSKFMVIPVQLLKVCFNLFLKWWRD
ncbi:hypothetical protein SLEP1_g57433 [Rubroshorea leprosula]|uniref:Secreted protein n=1 Tax=Rubroshorea leprosula TaxID=152421 RepID=A0AAV5MLN9_9ROSI|nr:hypothetical protein SLEP1_g57433 [Rubroshorea leprosula]